MTPSTDIGTTIIGAGVVGLAIAARLSKTSKDIYVIERNKSYGMETSSRNSEVIHAGLYYPKDSLKARLCVAGNRLLYDHIARRKIRHLPCGKLIVATREAEVETLESIRQNALLNGLSNLSILTGKEAAEMEPSVKAVAALHSPGTGVIDAHHYMRSLHKEACDQGVRFIFGAMVMEIDTTSPGRYGIDLVYPDGKPFSFTTRRLINCAGHDADRLAGKMGIDIDGEDYRHHFWKGDYFGVDAPPFPVKRLIYPTPLAHAVGLGIHATIDIHGKLKLGPDATFLPDGSKTYWVDPGKRDLFFNAVNPFLPFLQKETLHPEMAGIRPKRQKPGDPVKDFLIAEESARGLPEVVNLIGIESPGLTASLAIATHVYHLLNEKERRLP
jgi:L-2-hydroxyglutarate oxidase LhgO